jgi:hypothetical protein
MAGNKGDLISASDFNDLVSKYERFWGDVNSSSTFADLDKSQHVYGWGQQAVEPTVNAITPIYAEDWNRLIAQINAGFYHTDDVVTVLMSLYDAGTPIYASEYQAVDTKIGSIDGVKFNCSLADVDGYALINSNNSEQWQETTETTVKYTWSTYNDARYFFNSGGEITFDMDAVGGTSGADDWQGVFDGCGTIVIDVQSVYNTNEANPGLTPIAGFYGITDTETLIFTITGYTNYATGDYGEYGGHGALYNTRKVNVYAWAEETTEFNVYFRVELVDDIDSGIVNTEITLNCGHATPAEMPEDTEMALPIGDYFKAGSYTYQFQQREIPAITVHIDWVEN